MAGRPEDAAQVSQRDIAHGAERVGEPDVNESEAVRWVPLMRFRR